MPAPAQTLDEIRAEIDRIDQAVHDLLMQRVEVVRRVGKVKGASAPKWRPAREAALLRRLAARHKGEMPIGVLVRIWREMIVGGSLALQEAVSVSVAGATWDLARDHFGSAVPFKARTSAAQVVRDVASGKATIGVVPAPADGDPWWTLLAAKDAPKVVALLPFVAAGKARAVAIARVAFEPSGSDRSLLIAGTGGAAVLKKAGVPARRIARHGKRELVEVAGFVSDDDARINNVVSIGGYAVPLSKS